MKNMIAILLSICILQTTYTMDDNDPDRDVELASMATSPIAAHEPLSSNQPAVVAEHQAQSPLLAELMAEQSRPIHVHASASLNSWSLERKFDDLIKAFNTPKKIATRGVDGSLACSGSILLAGTLCYLWSNLKAPTCNCSCPAPTVVCSFPTPRPMPLSMDNGTMPNNTQTNMTTNANSTIPSSTSGFMQMLSTFATTNEINDTMPSLAPTTKLKRD